MNKHFFLTHNAKKYALYIVLFASALFLFFINFFGLDFTDSFYHLNNIEHSQEKYMTFLSYTLLGSWTQFFGDTLISLRIFNSTVTLLVVFIPLLFFRKKINNQTILFSAIAIFILTSTHSNVVGYDIITRLFLILVFALFVKFVHTGKTYFLILVGLFSILLTGARLQNIIIVPILLSLYFIHYYFKALKNNKRVGTYVNTFIKHSIIYVLLIAALGITGLLVFFNDPSHFLNAIYATIKNLIHSSSPHNSHSFRALLDAYIIDFIKLLQYLGFLFFIKYLHSFKVKSQVAQYVLSGFTVLLFAFFTFVGVIYVDKNFSFSPYYASIVLFIFLISSRQSIHEKRYDQLFLFITIVFFSLIPPFGSNTGLFKYFPFLVSVFPVTTLFYRYRISRTAIIYLMIVLLYASYTRLNHTNEDGRLTSHIQTNTTVDIPKLKHIRTSPERVQYLENVYSDYENDFSEQTEILFFGRVSHIVYYITGKKPLYKQTFWMQPDNPGEIAKAERVIKNKRPVVYYMPGYPDKENREKLKQEYSPFEKMVISLGYIEKNKGQYKRYEPQPISP
jgi:hypothetical protein